MKADVCCGSVPPDLAMLARISSIGVVRNPSLAGDEIVCNDGILELIP
jgi:hypothetical protein